MAPGAIRNPEKLSLGSGGEIPAENKNNWIVHGGLGMIILHSPERIITSGMCRLWH